MENGQAIKGHRISEMAPQMQLMRGLRPLFVSPTCNFPHFSLCRRQGANEKELQNGQRETPEWTGAWEAGRRVRNYVDCLL